MTTPSKPKPKPKPLATLQVDAETQALPVIEQASADARAYAVQRPAAEAAISAAEDHVSEVLSSARRADGKFTPADLAAARAGVEFAEARHKAVKQAGERAARRQTWTDTEIADVCERIAVEALGSGLSTVTTFAQLEGQPRDADRPALWIRQTSPTKRLANGAVAGEVEFTYLRLPLHRELEASDFEQAAERLGVSGSANGFVHSSGNLDRLRFSVHSAAPVAAVIERIEPFRFSALGRLLTSTLVGEFRYWGEPLVHDYETGFISSAQVRAVPFGDEVVDENIDGDRRELTLATHLAVEPLVDGLSLSDLSDRVTAMVEQFAVESKFVPGLGAVIALALVPDADVHSQAVEAMRTASGEAIDARLIGHEPVAGFQVIGTLASQLSNKSETEAA